MARQPWNPRAPTISPCRVQGLPGKAASPGLPWLGWRAPPIYPCRVRGRCASPSGQQGLSLWSYISIKYAFFWFMGF